MPWCPKCGYEYVQGIGRCADCGVKLVEQPPEKTGAPSSRRGDRSLVYLTTANGDIEAGRLAASLESIGIPVDFIYEGGGSFNRAVLGSTVMGVELFVDEHQLGRARAVLAELEKLRELAAEGAGGQEDDSGEYGGEDAAGDAVAEAEKVHFWPRGEIQEEIASSRTLNKFRFARYMARTGCRAYFAYLSLWIVWALLALAGGIIGLIWVLRY